MEMPGRTILTIIFVGLALVGAEALIDGVRWLPAVLAAGWLAWSVQMWRVTHYLGTLGVHVHAIRLVPVLSFMVAFVYAVVALMRYAYRA